MTSPSVIRISIQFVSISLILGGQLCRADLSFNRDIRPILSDACFSCHGPDSAHRQASLRLDVEDAALEYAIVPGNPDDSELVRRILSDDPDEVMPPPESGKQLTDDQRDLLLNWVTQGARFEPYWAYVPPKLSPVPRARGGLEADDPVDRFVQEKLSVLNLQPAQLADPATLIRRVTFDLTGLPPEPEQVRRFLSDSSLTAYQQYVDRLLASPAYGERMASYWLDLVRFADTVGYHGDQVHNITPYRDYVIDAFNENMPLDQFTREQIAGDLFEEPTIEQLIASGYNRLLQTSHEGGVQPKEYLTIYAADRVRNLSAVWLGATVGCAQCHDHKYDPYQARDFYQLAAFFADVDEAAHFKVGNNALPTKRPPEIDVLTRWQRDQLQNIERKIRRVDRRITRCQTSGDGCLENHLAVRDGMLDEQKRLLALERRTMITRAVAPRQIRILPRGNWMDDSGEVVDPDVPGFLPGLRVEDRRANRLDLADWLTDDECGVGGLTARVFVNRFWYLLFGRGISRTLDDLGGQGSPPTHPELLDRLSLDFIDGGWDVKRMMRHLVLTRTYRQSSEVSEATRQSDPANDWFARQVRFRLSAEMVRDNALCIGGLLVRQSGGASVKPPQPAAYYRHLNFPQRVYGADVDSRQWRRGVYVHWQRQFLHPMLKALDAPSREECTAQRPRSNTPLEALVLLNDPVMVDAAIGFAGRIAVCRSSVGNMISSAFRIALSREPTTEEMTKLERFFQAEYQYYSDQSSRNAASNLVSNLATRSDTDPATLAACVSVCRAILNLHETVTRS